jgi:DNA-binding NarL/FixJ family response regulator
MSAVVAEPMSSPTVHVEPDTRTAVVVYSKDPISRAGVTSQLSGWRGIVVVDPRQASRAAVALVVASVADEELLRVIRTIRRGSGAQVVLVLGEADPESVLAAADAGAIGMLHRSTADSEHLACLVAKAARGEPVLPDRWHQPGRAAASVDGAEPAPRSPTNSLSAREVEVLRLLADGCDTAQIARKLAYSEPTIKNVIQRLFDHLNVRNRPHAVAVAMRAGII